MLDHLSRYTSQGSQGSGKVRKKIFFKRQEKVSKFWNFVKSRKIQSKCQVCMISQAKSNNDVCSQERNVMAVFWYLLHLL